VDDPEQETRASDAPAADAPLAPDRWGPFERLQRVGRGAFGEVYRAFDPALRRHVALKLLLPGTLTPDEEVGALLREARAIARVRHPNVVSIHGVDHREGRVGFWSDFINGKTLAELVAAQGPMGAREAALIGIDVCRAAGAVHAAGFLHRDIKAANVMREEGGRILLMDFGLTHEHGMRRDAAGTPAYMAPELLLGEPATVASDIYGIGTLLFYLLTTHYPVEGTNLAAMSVAHATGGRRTLLDVRPDLPEPLARVVEKAIDAVPQKRFASAGQLVAALSEAIGLGAPPATAPVAAPSRRVRDWIIATVAAAALLLVGVVQWRAHTARGETPASAGVEADYRQAHDLLAHYYRPHAVEDAIALLEKIVALDARFAPAFADLGRANFLQFSQQRDTKYIQPARDASLRALALAPSLPSAHVTLAFVYAFTDQNDLAQHEVDAALRSDAFNAAAYSALAELQRRQGHPDQEEATLQKAVSLAPDDWMPTMQLGAHYLDRSEWTKAAAQFSRAVELVPDNPRAHNNLGLVYRGLGRLDDSAAAFQKSIDLEPTFIHYRNLGMVLAEAGQYRQAEQVLRRAVEIRPNQYRAWGLLASVYASERVDAAQVKGAYTKAIALAGDLLKETPKDEFLLADIGGYYAAIGQEKQALPLLAQAAALAPDTPEVLYEVAVGYEMLHHREEALRWLAKSIAGGYSSDAIARNPQLAALRADPRYVSAAEHHAERR
jgi:tetratricopeptide (TPR) repeat protein